MKIHEYQAKAILAKYGVPVPRGEVAFTVDEAEASAARVRTEAGADAGAVAWIRRAYQLAFGRAPEADELRAAEPVVRDHGLPTLCRVLFNSNEFLFLP